MKENSFTKTLKVRVRDKHAKLLNRMARSVNYVWNYCNQLSNRSIRERSKFLSGYDLQDYTKGANKELGLNSATVQMIGHEYVIRRKQFKKVRLAWRKSQGVRKSLGWIPVRKDCFSYQNACIKHMGTYFRIWDSYGMSKYNFKSGSFSEDARGRWYFNAVVEVKKAPNKATTAIGIDLGCKTAAVASNGDDVTGRNYRKYEQALGLAQRARNKKRIKTIHAKIKNKRSDQLHQFSREIVDSNAGIFVGNVSSIKLVKTKMAKSVLDAGWGQLKTMLEYKCEHAGVVFKEVNEAYTTQMCSSCLIISNNSPKGRADLGIREWTCECGITHDRDINSAKIILALGLGRLDGGIPHYNL